MSRGGFVVIRMVFTLGVGLWCAFVIWGEPAPSEQTAKAASAPTIVQTAGVFDTPTIVKSGDEGIVARAAAATATLVSATPQVPTLVGEPVLVSLITPGTVAAAAPAADTQDILVVTGSRVNLRSGPSTGNAVVSSLSAGTRTVPLGDASNGWQEVRVLDTGVTGFMAARFLDPA